MERWLHRHGHAIDLLAANAGRVTNLERATYRAIESRSIHRLYVGNIHFSVTGEGLSRPSSPSTNAACHTGSMKPTAIQSGVRPQIKMILLGSAPPTAATRRSRSYIRSSIRLQAATTDNSTWIGATCRSDSTKRIACSIWHPAASYDFTATRRSRSYVRSGIRPSAMVIPLGSARPSASLFLLLLHHHHTSTSTHLPPQLHLHLHLQIKTGYWIRKRPKNGRHFLCGS